MKSFGLDVIGSCYHRLGNLGKELGFAVGVWGSLPRGDFSSSSDVDLVVLRRSDASSNEIHESIKAALPTKHPIDISMIEIAALQQYPMLNGTSFHSVYFLSAVFGDAALAGKLRRLQDFVIGREPERRRELINLLANFHRLDHSAGAVLGRPGKFGRNGTSQAVRAVQCAQLLHPELLGIPTESVLATVASRLELDVTEVIDDWHHRVDCRHRLELECAPELTVYSADDEPLPLELLWSGLVRHVIVEMQESVGVETTILRRFTELIGSTSELITEPRIVSADLGALVKACVASDSGELASLAESHGRDWWIASNIALNPQTATTTLEYLLSLEDEIGLRRWQTIRLYVASNANASTQTLTNILSRADYRPQDHAAAYNNLRLRN